MPLDALDRRILRAIQVDNSRSAEVLSDMCGTSPSTLLRRLARLRRSGVIRSEVALVDGHGIGQHLLMIVTVRLERETADAVEQFRQSVESEAGVLQFYLVTGSVDYVILFSAATMEEFDAFVQARLIANPHVILTDTHVVIRPIKMSLALPIPERHGP